jgi:deoxyribonuclease-1
MRGYLVLVLFLLTFNVSAQTDRKLANGQIAYYGAEFYTGKVSKASLYKILASTHSIVSNKPDLISETCSGQCFKHTSVGYDGARRIMFGETFKENDSEGMFVTDVYCGKKFYFNDVSQISNMASQVNIEHTWPQSRFSSKFDKNVQKSDMHHLYPTDSAANNRRANNEFGDIGTTPDELNVENCSISKLGHLTGNLIFTPPVGHRGNVARSLFYFSVRYDIQIDKNEEAILRKWNQMDPVDAVEKSHHEIVAKYQKVRNPFVDYPELVEKVADF